MNCTASELTHTLTVNEATATVMFFASSVPASPPVT